MSDSRFTDLFRKYFDKTATPEERTEFMQHVAQLKSDTPLLKLMEEAYQSNHSLLTEFTPQVRERILFNVFGSGDAQQHKGVVVEMQSFKTGWIRYAAAILFILAGFGLYFYKKEKPDLFVQQVQDIAPGGNKAVLTLGNGKKIVLDAAANGVLAKLGNISISKTSDGQLIYNVKGEEHGIVSTNSIETPKGGQYQVNLPDGTRVWLNAASSLKYPTLFAGRERKVELEGEAYFEVSKDAKKPFKVKLSNNTEVEVLGTHFNVNAYTEEGTINTTLLEGAVRMKSGEHTHQILPGQQAQVNRDNNQIKLVSHVNINEVIAWKNGFFSTDMISLHALMNQVEKWYDVHVVYEDDVQAEFVAKLPRNVPLSELLRLLELTKKVHFKTEGKTITVMK